MLLPCLRGPPRLVPVGRVTALTGVAGGLSGMLFPVLTGWLADYFSYLPVFSLAVVTPPAGTAALFVVGRYPRSANTRSRAARVS